MAVLDRMPSEGEIAAFRGTVDFYMYKGLVVARSWPRKPKGPRSEAVQRGIDNFKAAIVAISNTSPEVIDAWKAMARNSPQTWRDYFMRGYLAGFRG